MTTAVTNEEFSRAQTWFESTFESDNMCNFPISFKLDGKESSSLLGNWIPEWTSNGPSDSVASYSVRLSDPDSQLECRCDIKLYKDFPAIEWVAYLKNNSDKPSPAISDIQAFDAVFPKPGKDAQWQLTYSKGSDHAIDDFQPMSHILGNDFSISSSDGRSSDGSRGGSMPFFNISHSGCGMIGAIGWTGDWRSSFLTEGYAGDLNIKTGMKKTHLKLFPGEEIRTPRMLMMFWDGDSCRAHNMFRQLILAHYRPMVNGKPLMAPICQGSWGEMMDHHQVSKARWWKEAGIDVDVYWIDAGWHGDAPFQEESDCFVGGWATQVGNWWPNKTTYPNGVKAVGGVLKELGRGFVLWLEPERVFKDTKLTHEHPEWLLGPVGDNYLFNLGISEARKYITDLVSSLVSESGITCYRQDFNVSPVPFWEAADAPDRIGMSEIRHVEGLYAFWDELLERYPYLFIDNCASGGKRIDLEMVSRSIPLWRSDFQCWPDFNPTGIQCQTQGLSMWVPLSTGCAHQVNPYAFRSAFGPGMVINANGDEHDPLPDFPIKELKKLVNEQRKVSKYFYGDFYPLLAFSTSDDVWALWQYDRPDLGEGLILALRRQASPFVHIEAQLRALEPEAQYELRSLDDGDVKRLSGGELMELGLPIRIDDKPGSVAFVYRRLDG